ncbi:Uncharacterized protein PECH_000262 [Penicillium ucsense]|uniref:Integral membrane protein n=1 Tax=Penicillium ucsense TaxID=2839758 RepID=A0A8J8W9S7_9EURO|nr:Uncharacterized protein PECM_008589 [Penicillium ucsense]KAF7738541.1 Uncharacterized protein PECH_000262 [Penicillium ucsense]
MFLTITRAHGLGLLLVALYASATAAANILPAAASASFPECGLSCTPLTQAQASCESGAQATWVSCFCQSALLPTLKTSGSLCTSCTAPADQALLSTWYNAYCNSNGQNTGNTSPSADTASTTAAVASPTASSSNSISNHASTSEVQLSWWSTHYKWVIMLIVLAIGFGAIAAVGVYLKRRHDAKRANLYHTGGPMDSSSGVLEGNSYSPSNSETVTTVKPAWAAPAGHDASQSLASSSRTEITTTRGGSTLPPGSRTRLPKSSQPSGNIEIHQRPLR